MGRFWSESQGLRGALPGGRAIERVPVGAPGGDTLMVALGGAPGGVPVGSLVGLLGGTQAGVLRGGLRGCKGTPVISRPELGLDSTSNTPSALDPWVLTRPEWGPARLASLSVPRDPPPLFAAFPLVPSSADRYPSSLPGMPGDGDRLPRARGLGHSRGDGDDVGEGEVGEGDRELLRVPGGGGPGESRECAEPMASGSGKRLGGNRPCAHSWGPGSQLWDV